MRWRWIMCVALVLLCGCSYQSSAAKYATYKQYLHQLVGDCARVDIQLMKLGPNPQPGQVADQLAGFAKKARSHTPPTVKRQKLANLLTEFDHAVREFRSAQTALNSGNTGAAHAAEKRAMQTINGPADRAARQYGMPHLTDCAKEMGLHQQGTSSGRHAWQSGTDSLYAVQQVPAAVVKNRIWVVGGLTSPLPSGLLQSTADTEFYDPTTREWGRGPQLPVALNHAMMVTYQGTLWVIGGFVPRGGNPTAGDSARVLMLNQAENAWIEKPMLHHARAAGAAAVVGNKIVVVGGRTGDPGKPVTVTEVFNGTSWQDATAIPTPADHLAAASDGKYLYAVGGDKLSTADDVAAVQRFNPATGTWSQLPPMSAAASGVGAAVVDGQLITLGGENLGTVFNTVRELDLATRAWSSLPPLPEARHGMGVAVIGTTLYAVGGAAQPGHTQSTHALQVLTLHPR